MMEFLHALGFNAGEGIEQPIDSMHQDVFLRPESWTGNVASLALAALTEFGELPVYLTKLSEALNNTKTDAKDIAELLQLDPGLAGKVLKLVNSAYYGLQGSVSSLQHAVSILGFNTVRILVTGVGAFSEMRRLKLPQDMPLSELWKHSVAVSQVGARIAKKAKKIDTATMVSAGLLHDSGKLLLAAIEPTRFLKSVRSADQLSTDLMDHELENIGISHPIMSAALARKWHLPGKLWETILYQQHPSLATHKREAATLMLAEFFTRNYEIGADGQGRRRFPPEEALDVLGIDYDKAEDYVLGEDMKIVLEQTEVIGEL